MRPETWSSSGRTAARAESARAAGLDRPVVGAGEGAARTGAHLHRPRHPHARLARRASGPGLGNPPVVASAPAGGGDDLQAAAGRPVLTASVGEYEDDEGGNRAARRGAFRTRIDSAWVRTRPRSCFSPRCWSPSAWMTGGLRGRGLCAGRRVVPEGPRAGPALGEAAVQAGAGLAQLGRHRGGEVRLHCVSTRCLAPTPLRVVRLLRTLPIARRQDCGFAGSLRNRARRRRRAGRARAAGLRPGAVRRTGGRRSPPA